MEKLVNEIINNAKTPFAEDDRSFLEGLSEDRLKAFLPKEEAKAETEEKPEVNEEKSECGCGKSKVSTNEAKEDGEEQKVKASEILGVMQNVLSKVDSIEKNLPNMVANAVDEKIKVDQKTPLINQLKMKGCTLSEGALNAMSIEDLQEMHKLSTNANYGIGGAQVNNEKSVGTAMTEIDWGA